MPCVGIIAIIPAVIAIVLAIVGLSRTRSNQGMLIGGLVVALIALMISVSQIFVIGKIATTNQATGPRILKRWSRMSPIDIEKEFGDKEVTIHVNNGDETVEIKATTRKNDLENKLDELEGTVDTVKQPYLRGKAACKVNRTADQRAYFTVNVILAGVILLIMGYSGFYSPDENKYPVRAFMRRLPGNHVLHADCHMLFH